MRNGDTIKVGDVALFVRQLGRRVDRPSLLVIHGGPDWDHSYLLPGVEPLASDHHVVLFDLRGCGRSTRGLPVEAYQPEHVIADIYGLINVLELGPVDVLGFSAGGRIATRFLSDHQAQVRRVVLASTSAYGDSEHYLRGWSEYERRRGQQAEEDAISGDTYEPWARNAASTAIWNLALMPAYQHLLSRVRFSGDWMRPWRAGTLRPWCQREPVTILQKCRKPILILHGAQDMCFPVECAYRLHAQLAGSTLKVLDGAGHMAHFERPDAWAHHIRRFLQGST